MTCTFCGSDDITEIDAFAQNDTSICVRCVAVFVFLKEAPVGLPATPGDQTDPEDLRSETLRVLQERAEPDDGRDRSSGHFPSRRARKQNPQLRFQDTEVPSDDRCHLCDDSSGDFRPFVMNRTGAVICPSCLGTAAEWLKHPARH